MVYNLSTMEPTVIDKTKDENPMKELLNKTKGGNLVLKEGDIIRGVVLEKRPKQVYVDLGLWGTGIVYGYEFINAADMIKSLEVNSELFAKIVDLENDNGFIELSLEEAGKQKSWELAQTAFEKEEVLSIPIVSYN